MNLSMTLYLTISEMKYLFLLVWLACLSVKADLVAPLEEDNNNVASGETNNNQLCKITTVKDQ